MSDRPAPASTVQEYERLAQDFVAAYEGDAEALARMNAHYGRPFTLDDLKAEIWRRVYAFRQRSSRVPKNYLQLTEAQIVLAQDAGFGSWETLLQFLATGTPRPVAAYVIDTKENRASPARRMTDADWDELIGVMREQRITAFDAGGLMTDRALARLATLDHVTRLNLGGSREMTDDGLLLLARMPQLQHLELSEYPGGRLTDRGLEVLRHLPDLRNFEMTWQAGISDAGVANLRYCEQLENVNLMGSPTGDGAIKALAGKPRLRRFCTGRLATDEGLRHLRGIPRLLQWNDEGAELLIDGEFSDAGLAGLAGLEGVGALDLFWHTSGITSDAFVHLARLPNLQALACDGKLADDTAMRHFAAIPRLRKLRAQEAAATDEGFVALSQSKTLESFWGRDSKGLGNRGFAAMSRMASLRNFGTTLQNVDDETLALLPEFPALRELTPIGVQDPGFRHVGRCARLERLTCMYCRETTDVATGHIVGLENVKYYYAGLTKITDRSLEILGRMASLEEIEFYECLSITDAGLPYLAALPRLREVHLDSLPGVTLEGTRVFPSHVRVCYST